MTYVTVVSHFNVTEDHRVKNDPETKGFAHRPGAQGKYPWILKLIEEMELLTRLEANSLAGSDADLGASPRIAADAGLAWLDGEDAKAAKLDPVARDEGLLHGFEDGINSGLRFGSGKTGPLDDSLDEILLDQEGTFLLCHGDLGSDRHRSPDGRKGGNDCQWEGAPVRLTDLRDQPSN